MAGDVDDFLCCGHFYCGFVNDGLPSVKFWALNFKLEGGMTIFELRREKWT
jgi:hypothetical protein